MKTAIKPREAPARERSCTEPQAKEASWVERGRARARNPRHVKPLKVGASKEEVSRPSNFASLKLRSR